MSEVQSLWKSAVDAVRDIEEFISKFIKKFWNDVQEFVRRIQGLNDNVKIYVVDATLKATDMLSEKETFIRHDKEMDSWEYH